MWLGRLVETDGRAVDLEVLHTLLGAIGEAAHGGARPRGRRGDRRTERPLLALESGAAAQ